ncbi:hypothetical protein RPSD_02410 [Ralstonia solanacearum]|nr:hypothetical protein RPSD_02410 [Ralstonia solanacearum]
MTYKEPWVIPKTHRAALQLLDGRRFALPCLHSELHCNQFLPLFVWGPLHNHRMLVVISFWSGHTLQRLPYYRRNVQIYPRMESLVWPPSQTEMPDSVFVTAIKVTH